MIEWPDVMPESLLLAPRCALVLQSLPTTTQLLIAFLRVPNGNLFPTEGTLFPTEGTLFPKEGTLFPTKRNRVLFGTQSIGPHPVTALL